MLILGLTTLTLAVLLICVSVLYGNYKQRKRDKKFKHLEKIWKCYKA